MSSSWPGHFYDGRTARRQKATLVLSQDALIIERTDQEPVVWPYAEVRLIQGRYATDAIRLERTKTATESVVVADRRILEALRSLPEETNRVLFSRRAGRSQVALAFGLAVIALLIFGAGSFWGLPAAVDLIARKVPPAWEEKLGRSVVERWFDDLEQAEDPELLKAVNGMADKLNQAAMPHPYEFKIQIIQQDGVINAFAMPGGYIVVFSGLIEKTETPEELAGVLAHEMQHVLQKHATKSLIKNTSTSLLLELLFGNDDFGSLAASSLDVLEQFRYSRLNEEEADKAGARLMARAAINPRGLTDFFKHLETDEQNALLPSYLSTHPATAERIKMLEEHVPGPEEAKAYPSLMPASKWQAMIASFSRKSKAEYDHLAINTLREAISKLEAFYLDYSRYPEKLSDCKLEIAPEITITYSRSQEDDYTLTSCHENGSVTYTWNNSEMKIKERPRGSEVPEV